LISLQLINKVKRMLTDRITSARHNTWRLIAQVLSVEIFSAWRPEIVESRSCA